MMVKKEIVIMERSSIEKLRLDTLLTNAITNARQTQVISRRYAGHTNIQNDRSGFSTSMLVQSS
jgi:hypothetical protein